MKRKLALASVALAQVALAQNLVGFAVDAVVPEPDQIRAHITDKVFVGKRGSDGVEGRFAYRSDGKFWSNQAYHNDGQVIEAYWYAPAVRRIVKYEGRWWGKGGVSSVGRSIQQELKWELAEYKLA